MALEAKLEEYMKGREGAKAINLARTEFSIENGRGHNLHVRWSFPKCDDDKTCDHSNIRAAIFYIHGYASHVNRPTYDIIGEAFAKNGIAFIAPDLHGHGYSDGVKVAIYHYEDLIDDIAAVFEHFYKRSETPLTCPFVIMGQSMGGALAILTSALVSNKYISVGNYHNINRLTLLRELTPKYIGSILLCPAISVNLPPAVFKLFLDYVFVPFFPEANVPKFLTNIDNNNLAWKSESFIKYIEDDGYPANPHGLSFSESIRFCTAKSLMDMMEEISVKMSQMSFPFVAIHDPNDEIVTINGTRTFYEKNKSCDKNLVLAEGGLHDLLTNSIDLVFETALQFTLDRLSRHGEGDEQ